MKKTLLGILALFSFAAAAQADGLVVADAGIQAGKTATVQVALSNTSGESYRAVLFSLTLPSGITMVKDEFDEPVTTAETAVTAAGYGVTANELTDGSFRFAVVSTSGDEAIPAECGPLFSFDIRADEGLSVGDVLTATLSDIKLTDAWAVDHDASNAQFSITLEDPRVTLDENSTVVPASATGVDVRVLRTITAGDWSTLCLPFDMTEEQVYEAFGCDVQLAQFIDYDVDDEESPSEITVNFEATDLAADGLMANVPYIIKVISGVSSFTVDGVNIDPDEENAKEEYADGKGSKRHVHGFFKGTYHAGTTVPENNLFVSSSQFWYSKGLTKMKAFRAYFWLEDVLASGSSARIKMSFGDASGIRQVREDQADEACYNLQGQRVEQPGRGLYIRGGKKIMVK